MSKFNAVLFILGIALQILLLGVLVARRHAARVPAFTSLIGFFLLRTVLLRVLAGHTDPDVYMTSSSALSLLDTLLEIVVAFELFRAAMPVIRQNTHWRSRWPMFVLLVVITAGFAWGVSALVPSTPRHPIDRGILFTAGLLLAVAIRSRWNAERPLERRILMGFIPLSLIGIAAQIGQSLAAVHRNVATFKAWSYAEPLTFLLVLLYWTAALYRTSLKKASAHAFNGRTLRRPAEQAARTQSKQRKEPGRFART